jgi:hypothetical protein
MQKKHNFFFNIQPQKKARELTNLSSRNFFIIYNTIVIGKTEKKIECILQIPFIVEVR